MTERESSNGEAYFRALSENSLAGEFVIQDGRTLYVNPAMAGIFGYTQQQLIGRDPLLLIHPEDRPAIARLLKHKGGNKSPSSHFECLGLHKDGHAIEIHVLGGFPVKLKGRPARVGSILEVTQHKQAEEQLQKLSQAVEQSPATVIITDAQANIEFVNPKFTQLTGYTPEEVTGKNPRMLKSHLTPPSTYQKLWETLRSGREWRGEFANRKKNGEIYWESASISPIKDSAGVTTHFVSVKEDISERKKTEEALRKAEEDFRRLFAEAAEGIFRVSTEGRFLLANPAVARILGYGSAAEFVCSINNTGLQLWETPEERQMVVTLIEEQGAVRGHECRFKRKDGSLVWVSLNVRNSIGRDGRTEYYQGYFEDITERRRGREALEEAHRKLARSMEILKSRSEEITILSEFARLLQSCLRREEAYRIIKSFSQKLFPGFAGGVYLTAASRNIVQVAASWGESIACQASFTPDECWALRSGHLHCVAEDNAPARCAHMPPGAEVAYLCLPLMAQGEGMGILHLECGTDVAALSAEDWESFKRSRQELAVAVAEHVALAVANLQLRETLRTQSIRDPLTGLYNRRYMEESLEREILRASRNNRTIGVLLLDIDHFKRYNDTFGHEAGDTVLREVGLLLQRQVRGEDIACRFGGEEFLVILPDTPHEVVLQRAEGIREAVRQLTVNFHGQTLGAVTISIGVAIYPLQGRDAATMLESADKALYTAKESGRNRSAVATPVASQD